MSGTRDWRGAMRDLAGFAAALAAAWIHHRLRGDATTPRAADLLVLAGVILVAGTFAGRLAGRVGLPRLTGYLLAGICLNPSLPLLVMETLHAPLPALVPATQAKELKLVNELAVSLIALMAGAEIRLSWLRSRLRAIVAISAAELILVPPIIVLAVLGLAWLAPVAMRFVGEAGAAGVPAIAVAVLIAAILLANSPTVVVSVLKETGATGPLARTVMGVSVLMDAVVILAFTLVVAAIASLGGAGAEGGLLAAGGGVALSVLLSIAVGCAIGLLLHAYTERTDHRLSWGLIGLSLAVAALEQLIGVHPLFCLLAAGFACENLLPKRSSLGTHRLDIALRRVATPVFVGFFVVAGLNLDLLALAHAWWLVLVLSLVRLIAVRGAVAAGVRLADAEVPVRRYAWIGMVSQAGVTLALTQIAAARFPGWGDTLATFIVAMVGLHEMVGPVAFTWALRRAGEATRTTTAHAAH